MCQVKTVMPVKAVRELISYLHKLNHLSTKKMNIMLSRQEMGSYTPKKETLIQQIVSNCKACAQVNAGKTNRPPGLRLRGHRPGIHWKIDVSELKPGMYGYRYLLVFTDSFSGWVEAFPTKKETAQTAVKKF